MAWGEKSKRSSCCAAGKRFIKLAMPSRWYGEHEDDTREQWLESARTTPAQWHMTAKGRRDPEDYPDLAKSKYEGEQSVIVIWCPFCGFRLPPVRLRAKPPKKICVTINGGESCDTCNARHECGCATADRLWEPVP